MTEVIVRQLSGDASDFAICVGPPSFKFLLFDLYTLPRELFCIAH